MGEEAGEEGIRWQEWRGSRRVKEGWRRGKGEEGRRGEGGRRTGKREEPGEKIRGSER